MAHENEREEHRPEVYRTLRLDREWISRDGGDLILELAQSPDVRSANQKLLCWEERAGKVLPRDSVGSMARTCQGEFLPARVVDHRDHGPTGSDRSDSPTITASQGDPLTPPHVDPEPSRPTHLSQHRSILYQHIPG